MGVELAREELYGAVADTVTAQNGGFHWTEDADRGGEEWVPAGLGGAPAALRVPALGG